MVEIPSSREREEPRKWSNAEILQMYLHGALQKSKNMMQQSQRGLDVVPLRTKEAREKLGKREWRSLSALERIVLATLDVERDLYHKFVQLQQSQREFGRPVLEAGLLPSMFLNTQRKAVREGKDAIEGDIRAYKDLWYAVTNADHFFQLALAKAEQARARRDTETWKSALQECRETLNEKLAAVRKARETVGMLPWDFDKVVLTEEDEQAARNSAMALRKGTPSQDQAVRGYAYQRRIDDELNLAGHEQTLNVMDHLMKKATAIIDRLLGKRLLAAKLPPSRVVYILSQHAVWIAMREKTVHESMEDIKKEFTPEEWERARELIRTILTDTSAKLKE